MNKFRICPDVTFVIKDDGVLASNHRARKHVWLSLALFRYLAGDPNEGPFEAADLTSFSNLDDHFADPTCIVADPESPEKMVFATIEEAAEFLAGRMIVCRGNDKEYYKNFEPKESILDRHHIGTFHQQVGYNLLLERRLEAEGLWNDNKLDDDRGVVKGALYRYVQQPFMERYFAEFDLAGKVVIDFGCGNGMASRLMTRQGAEVIGIDPDRNRLARAKEISGESFTPVEMDLSSPDPLSVLPDRSVDLVWMSDVLLFYFYPVRPEQPPVLSPDELLRSLAGNLRPGGRCVLMEPHGVFWLAPRLGSIERPYTVLTEYGRKKYSVAPGLGELAEAIAGAGLLISRIFEPIPENECSEIDPKAFHFARDYPQWWVFELVKQDIEQG